MTHRLSTSWTGQGQSMWPLVLLLLVAVAVPAACVLWFMTEAMRNEQLAVQGRLTTVYRSQLDAIRQRLNDYWREKEAALAAVDMGKSARETFAELVRSQAADSVIVYDSSGQVAYPVEANDDIVSRPSESPEWRRAWELEFQQQDFQAAADVYRSFVGEETPANTAARALRSQARCLVKADQKEAALSVLIGEMAQEKYREAIDRQGHFIFPNVQLRALELIADPKTERYRQTLVALVVKLNDYSDLPLPGSQRRFLMQQLSELVPEDFPALEWETLVPDGPDFPTLEGEMLAAEYLEFRQSNPHPSDGRRFRPSGFDDVWELTLPGQPTRVVALFREEHVFGEIQSLIETELSVPDAMVDLVPPNGKSSEPEPFLSGPAGELLPDWQLALRLDDSDPFGTAADSRIAMYLYSGVVVVLAMVGLAGLVARSVGRQIRVTRLRNDLIATVSHELKTPLSSIRALVDTLLEGRYHDERQQREYLQLAAKENERLSRLIDNFLAFSRFERNGETFEFAEVEVETIVTAAIDAVAERYEASESQVDVKVAAGLPAITGDAEALVTVLVNLLDNAHKYTENDKRITLRANSSNGQVCFEVEDNGVGLTRREAKKVFDRFHQVDQSLTRRAGGCGLGLSIVQFIVKAHGGSVDVSSQPGQGSTFTVTLAAAQDTSVERTERNRIE